MMEIGNVAVLVVVWVSQYVPARVSDLLRYNQVFIASWNSQAVMAPLFSHLVGYTFFPVG